MVDPVSLGGVGIAASLLGGATGAAGSIMSGSANSSAYSYKAGIALMNAQIAKQNAAWATNSGGIKASEEGLKDAQEKGQTIATQGASNIDVSSGSHAVVQQTQTDVAKYNQGIIMADAAHTAYGYETQAAADTAEAQMDTSAASNAKTAGYLGALSSIIGAAGSVGAKWLQGNSIGMFGGGNNFAGQMVTGGPSGPGTFLP